MFDDAANPAAVEEPLLRMADDVWDWCEAKQTSGRTVTVKAKYRDFRIVSRSRTLTDPVASRGELHDTALALVAMLYPLEMPVRLVGVTLSNLTPMGVRENSLLDLIGA